MQDVSPDSLMAFAIVIMVLCTALVSLRLIGRAKQKLHIGLDDVFAVLAWVGLMGMSVNMIVAVAAGSWGVPLLPLASPTDQPDVIEFNPPYLQSQKFVFAHELILPLQLAFAKLSILFFYRRLLCVERRSFLHWATCVTAAMVSLWGAAMFFVFLLQCGSDVSVYWSQSIEAQAKACLGVAIERFAAASDLALDAIVLALPVRRLATLRITPRQKLLVGAVFATGALSVAASAVRLYVYLALLAGVDGFDQVNPNLLISMLMFWGLFEAAFAVVAVCLPNTKFFLDRAVAKIKTVCGNSAESCPSPPSDEEEGGAQGHSVPMYKSDGWVSGSSSSAASRPSQDVEKVGVANIVMSSWLAHNNRRATEA